MKDSNQDGHLEAKDLSPKASSARKFIAVAIVAICIFVSWHGAIEERTNEYIDSSFKQAIFAFGGAKALNAGISFLQSAEFGASIGISASIQPFQILDPIDDMVETYSTAMQYSIGSLVIQKLLLKILSTKIFKFLLLISGAAFITCFFIKLNYSEYLFKGFLLLTIIRFMFSFTILLNGYIDTNFIEKETKPELMNVENTSQIISKFQDFQTKTNIGDIEYNKYENFDNNLKSEETIISKLKKSISGIENLPSPEKIKERIEKTIESIFKLTALFIFKTLIMPILFLFSIFICFKKLWGIDIRKAAGIK